MNGRAGGGAARRIATPFLAVGGGGITRSSSSRDCMPTIEIKIALAFVRIEPDTFAAFSDDRHLLVSRELELLFERDNLI